MGISRTRPFHARRWLRHLPLSAWLDWLRPAWRVGTRELLLTHSGRRGLRHTLLDVVAHDPASDTYIVAPAQSKRSDWFRSVQLQPHVLVDVGDRRFEAIATRLSEAEARHAVRDYARQRPSAFHAMAGAMSERHLLDLSGDYRTLAAAFRLIALRPLYG